MARSMSDHGISDLVADEGEVLKTYRCPAGVLTIGVGLTKASGVVDPKPGMTITHAESRRLLREALRRNYEPRVNRRMPGTSQHVFDGATSFDFNTGRIHNASWPGLFLAGDRGAAERSFKSWNKGGGRVLSGLVNRRNREWQTIAYGKYHAAALTVAPSLTPAEQVRERLEKLGFTGPTAVEAVKAFQRAKGLTVDGLVGPATRSELHRAEEARLQNQSTATGGATGGVAGGGSELATDPAVSIDTLAVMGTWAVVAALVVFAGFMVWRFRGPIFAGLPEPVKDFAQDRLGITIGRRVSVPA